MKKQPEKIYLQIKDYFGEELGEITWCKDKIYSRDIEYIRADAKLIKFLKEVIAAQDRLLICYRLGGQPAEWVLDTLSKAKEIYGDLQKIEI